MTYHSLQERFKTVQIDFARISYSSCRKLAELDFVSRYLETILHHISQGILFIDLEWDCHDL